MIHTTMVFSQLKRLTFKLNQLIWTMQSSLIHEYIVCSKCTCTVLRTW